MPLDERINMRFETGDLEKLRKYAGRRQFNYSKKGQKVNSFIRLLVKELLKGEIIMKKEFEYIKIENKHLEEENKRLKNELTLLKNKYKIIQFKNTPIDIRGIKEKIDLIFDEAISE